MVNGLAGGTDGVIEERMSPPVDDLVLTLLEAQCPRTFDDLVAALPTLGWPAVFLAIDRLSRAGRLLLRPAGRGGYQVSLKSPVAAA